MSTEIDFTRTSPSSTSSRTLSACGVFVEYIDTAGHTLGHAVFPEWYGRCVPGAGDVMVCRVTNTFQPGSRKLSGTVTSCQFDMQHDENGHPTVWVYLAVQAQLTISQDGDVERSQPIGQQVNQPTTPEITTLKTEPSPTHLSAPGTRLGRFAVN